MAFAKNASFKSSGVILDHHIVNLPSLLYHPSLVCILFGMPSLHFECFLSLVSVLFCSVTVRPKPKKNVSLKCNHNPRTGSSIDSLVVVPSI